PSLIAFCTAQFGSCWCVQSLNLQSKASSSISEKDFVKSAFIIPSSLIPGVSITTPKFGKIISSRLVVVCLHLSSFLISFVSIVFCPCKQLIRVDFPTPDDPINAAVLPLERNLFKDLYPSSEVLVVTSTSTPKAIEETSLSLISMSLHKSDFVRTI